MTPIDLVLSKLSGVRRGKADQWSALCPAHDDHDPSLSVGIGKNGQILLNCHRGCSFEEVLASLGLKEKSLFVQRLRGPRPARRSPEVLFPASTAEAVWARALERARSETRVADDEGVYRYLVSRKLEESWEAGAYGILAEGMDLPPEVADWPRRGYRLVAALHDLHGRVVNVQARRIGHGTPKTLLPKGSQALGTVFASRSGVQLLRAPSPGRKVLLGEGLTDFLALSIVSPVPVLSAPGTTFFESAIGTWVVGLDLYLAPDLDAAGTSSIEPTARAARHAGARRVAFLNWPSGRVDACDALVALGAPGLAEFLERELGAQEGVHAAA